MSSLAFCLGNGLTRLEINPDDLLPLGKVYACNRAYCDFTPHVLVSTDREMAQEIQKSGYSKRHTHYTRSNNILQDSGAIPIPKNAGYSSGPVAVTLAALDGHRHIYLVGMDLVGLNNRINNIYAGTTNYRNTDSAAVHYGNWISQIADIAGEFRTTEFFHVNPLAGYTPPEWSNLRNFSIVNLNEFRNMINNL